MINRRFNRLKNPKKIIYPIIITVLFVTIGIINVAYSKYGSNFEVKVNSSSGKMIIEATVDDKEEYLENGLKYFNIIVKNHNESEVTAMAIDYKITITNQDGSTNGNFYYVDQNGNTNEELTTYQKELTIDGYSFTTTAETMIFKVYIKVDSGLTEDVKYNIVLDAEQKEME